MNRPKDSFRDDIGGLQRADSMLALSLDERVEHIIDETSGNQFLRISSETPYPSAHGSIAIRGLLLDQVNVDDHSTQEDSGVYRYLRLPINYITMGQALNDAIGDRTTPNTLRLASGLFSELGQSLAAVARADRVVPKDFNYRKVLISRDIAGLKLLPPIELVDVEDPEAAQERVTTDLWDSCVGAAREGFQKTELETAFAEFKKTFVISGTSHAD